MTTKERQFIIDNDFDALWDLLWLNKHSKQYQNEYNNSKKKFNSLKEGITIFDKLLLKHNHNLSFISASKGWVTYNLVLELFHHIAFSVPKAWNPCL